jgi:hypothetical protein
MIKDENESNFLKRNDLIYIYSKISKLVNTIKDKEILKEVKKESMLEIHKVLVVDKPEIKIEHLEEIIISFNKDFLSFSLYFKESEIVREYALKTLIFIYSKLNISIIKILPFVISDLLIKLECNDLEGWGHLPDDIKPTPSSNPQKTVNLTEHSETIRVLYLFLLQSLFLNENITQEDFSPFINDTVNILRCLTMDPCNDIIKVSCETIKIFATKFKEKLYYFNSILGRSLFLALISKQSKIKILALEALDCLLNCSPFKKNYEIMEGLIGFRDPNIVPIKDFYEPSYKINYLAMLVNDGNISVRKKFFDIISDWLICKEDRYDMESRLVPYILTGLFDSNEDIADYCYQKILMIGKKQEEDNEKDMREEVQYGVDSLWTFNYIPLEVVQTEIYNPEDHIKHLSYPSPIKSRPPRGSRFLIKKYLRRYVRNLCKEFDAIDMNIKLKASNLLLYSICFSEELTIEFLNEILFCVFRELSKKQYSSDSENALKNMHKLLGNKYNGFTFGELKDAIELKNVLVKVCKMIGRFCDYESIVKIVYPTLKGDMFGLYSEIHKGALISLKYIIEGHNEGNIFPLGVYGRNIHSLFKILTPVKFDIFENFKMTVNEDLNRNEYFSTISSSIENYQKTINFSKNEESILEEKDEEDSNLFFKEGKIFTDSSNALDIIDFYCCLSELSDLKYFNSPQYFKDIIRYISVYGVESLSSPNLNSYYTKKHNIFDSNLRKKFSLISLQYFKQNLSIDILNSLYLHFITCLTELNPLTSENDENKDIILKVNESIIKLDKYLGNHSFSTNDIYFKDFFNKYNLNESSFIQNMTTNTIFSIFLNVSKLSESNTSLIFNSPIFKLFTFIIKSDSNLNIFSNYNCFIILLTFYEIFKNEIHYLTHLSASSLFQQYIENKNFDIFIKEKEEMILVINNTKSFKYKISDLLFEIIYQCFSDYKTIDYSDNKIKYIDLLEADSVLNKKQKKTVKYFKSKIKLKVFISLKFLISNHLRKELNNEKNVFEIKADNSKVNLMMNKLNLKKKELSDSGNENKNSENMKEKEFSVKNNDHYSLLLKEELYLDKISGIIINEDLVEAFYLESEDLRIKFSELIYSHSVHLMLYITKKGQSKMSRYTKKSDLKDVAKYLKILNGFEKLYLKFINDSCLEVRKQILKSLNVYLSFFSSSDLLDPLKKLFSDDKDSQLNQQLLFQSLTYIKDEEEYIKLFFENFDSLFSSGIKIAIEEKNFYSSDIEYFFRCMIEKFPIYCLNKFREYDEKGMLNRVELIDKYLKKYIK